jgi:hypothetical protein
LLGVARASLFFTPICVPSHLGACKELLRWALLPAGIVYLTLKAASFLFSLLMGIPLIASVVGTVSGTLGY